MVGVVGVVGAVGAVGAVGVGCVAWWAKGGGWCGCVVCVSWGFGCEV